MTNDTILELHLDPALLMARQALYRLAASSLLDPRAGSWQHLDALRKSPLPAAAADLIRLQPEAQPEQLGLGELPLEHLDPALVLQRLPDSAEALNDEYENTFGLLVSNACPPYETEYINSKFTFQRSHALADVSGYYQAFGLRTSDEHPDRADHIVLELEFLAFLLSKQRSALKRSGDGSGPEITQQTVANDRVRVCHDAQVRFFEDHVVWWVPAFARLLGRENSHGFYAAVALFLSALIPAERGLLNIAAGSQPAVPSVTERPEQCEGCQLNGS